MSTDGLNESVQELYEHAPCGYIVTAPDGTITRANRTFLDWTGYAADEMLGSTRFQDLLTVPGRMFFENQCAPLLRLQGFVKEIAFDLVCRNRAPLPVLVTSVQRSGPDGKPVGTLSIIFDATDRRAYERELLLRRREAEQLAAIVTNSSDAILTASPTGDVLTWNAGAEHLFAIDARDAIGRNLRDIVPALELRAYDATTGHDPGSGRAVHVETAALRADGQRVDLSVAITPHLGPLGELSGVSLIIRDVTEQRALERLQQEFLAMASHELRNPVAAIKGHTQLMQRRQVYSQSAVDTIVAQANHLGRLIDDLLLASQIEADRLGLRPVPLDLVELARAVTGNFGAQGYRVRLEVLSEPIPVSADRQRLEQVFANLLGNAIKYSPADSEVVLQVRGESAVACASVIDTGMGIAADALPHLFDRFYRVEGSAQRAQGLGLGLFITRRIVEGHAGSISVVSELGQGSTFTVTLPMYFGPT